MQPTTESLERAHGRIEQLYEISRLLTNFQDVERTLPKVLDVTRRALPLRSACLIDQRQGAARMSTWHAPELSETRLRAGADHAREAYAWLAGERQAEPLSQPLALDVRSVFSGSSERAHADAPERFVVMPLIAAERVHGVIQFEGVSAWDEADLAFMNAIAREIAVVLERRRACELRGPETPVETVPRYEFTVAAVAHDLKTPVFTVLLGAQLILKSDTAAPPGSETRKLAESIERAAQRMNGMIHDLLDFDSLQAGVFTLEKVPCEIDQLVAEALEQQQIIAAHRRQTLRAAGGSDGARVLCDRDGVLRVFANLLGNAIKYTPAGGVITVRAEVRNDSAWFAIEDRGPGIAPERLRRLFDRDGETSVKSRGSHGLGLAIARGIVESHGGQIKVESRVGVGTTFSFSLPLRGLVGRGASSVESARRKNLEGQSLQAQRLTSLGVLAGGVAHDLNNALAPVLMLVTSMQKVEHDDALRQDLELIETCVQRAAGVGHQLVTFARGAVGRPTKIHLGEVFAEVQKVVEDTFPKEVTVRWSVSRDLRPVNADADQLRQVLTTLCANARDAMPGGGLLTVALENLVLDEVSAGMNLDARPGAYVRLSVEDSGAGMSPEVLDQIFDPYFTTREFGKGTGLGLSIARAIVRGYGGFIHAYSEVGRGTCLKVYLPADLSTATAESAVEPSGLPRGHGELVLVVDDEEAIRTVARRTLERYGYRVMLAAHGAEALSHYTLWGQEIAAILIDMVMPVMDGPSTIAALRSLNPKVRIIASSGLHAHAATDLDAQHFVPKPYTAEAILKALQKILAEPE